ncbi:Sec-independent protein translocase protein TatB [Poseidonocella sp. HB161398]|uniref:Sec-independent protein translocase protein TatB n=1 Tax=Poseidonocella sp. HB161398 TaxID=2320855 RepID=UPI001107F877|nr:Sec-independent protein translocase protein TatB [Poseidonocella sp. HB161398]
MFDIGWTELVVIGVVALIVVGPKDLPVMFRTLGQFTGKARAMAREFTSAMNAAADEAGVKDVEKSLRDISNPRAAGMRKMQDAADAFEKWDPMAGRDGKSGGDGKSAADAPKAPAGPSSRAEAEAAMAGKAATGPAPAPAAPEAPAAGTDSQPDKSA